MDAVKPVMLIIRDGWGIRTMEHGNAPLLANTPNDDRWNQTLERSVLDASAEAVGLVPDQMGNSEVGHLNLGSGRIVYQDITRIDMAIQEGTLGGMAPLQAAFKHVNDNKGNLHLIGLLSPGGVHSHQRHLFELIRIAKAAGVNPVIHVITDGRDTPTEDGINYLADLQKTIENEGNGRIATVIGRYYAMDRDNRWERTGAAYDAIAHGNGITAETPDAAIRQSYDEGVTDEFIKPTVIDGAARLQSGDAVVCFNFRADRMRQMSKLFANVETGYEGQVVDDIHLVTFTEYTNEVDAHILFEKDNLEMTLAEVLSQAGKKQYHSAETEKYPHVTFFFNGRREEPFEGEDRKIVPSPKVATYDLQPEMSAHELTEATLDRLENSDDDFVLVNFANPDMVGHTGSLEAAIKACEVVDECVGKLVEKVTQKGGVSLVTADHGNCDRMVDEITGEPHTYHTTQPVALFVIGEKFYEPRPRGILADVAPTVLHLLGLDQPEQMTGRSLVMRVRDDA